MSRSVPSKFTRQPVNKATVTLKCSDRLWSQLQRECGLPEAALSRIASGANFATKNGDIQYYEDVGTFFLLRADTLSFELCGKTVMAGSLNDPTRTYTVCGEVCNDAVAREGGKIAGTDSGATLRLLSELIESSTANNAGQNSASKSDKILFAYDPVVLGHIPPLDRTPEAPQRVRRAVDLLGSHSVFGYFTGLKTVDDQLFLEGSPQDEKAMPTTAQKLQSHLQSLQVPTRNATPAEIYAVHDEATYKSFIEEGISLHEKGPLVGHMPTDVYCVTDNNASQKAVLASCGLAIDALKKVVLDDAAGLDGAFCLIRPPGHHCGCSTPNGFCLVNNVVVAVKALLDEANNNSGNDGGTNESRRQLRVAIVDCDVHHGEGTQSLVENDDRILFYSTHRCDDGTFFPYGTGKHTNFGGGCGQCINVPFDTAAHVPAECYKVISDYAFLRSCEQLLVPALQKFQPDVVVVSCGFDSLYGDPLGRMAVTPNGYRNLIETIRRLGLRRGNSDAGNQQPTKIVAVLEGGYNSEAVSHGVAAVYGTLLLSGSTADEQLAFTNPLCEEWDGGTTAQAFPFAVNPNYSGKGTSSRPLPVLPQTWADLRAKQEREIRRYRSIIAERGPTKESPAEEVTSSSAAESEFKTAVLVEPVPVPRDDVLVKLHTEWVEETVDRVRRNHPFLRMN